MKDKNIYSSAGGVIDAYFRMRSEVVSRGDLIDGNGRLSKLLVSAGPDSSKKSYEVYPWGGNNRLPNEMVALLRSSSDMGNLLNTRADFLYGAGIGLFTKKVDGNDLVMEPVWKAEFLDFFLSNGVDELVDTAILNLVQLNNSFINVSNYSGGNMAFKCMDATTVRAVKVLESRGIIDKYVVSGRWDDGGNKYADVVPRFDYTKPNNLPEGMVHLKPQQPGQFYYAYAIWWALNVWIEVSNKIAPFHRESLETEGNLGNIIHIAKRYFDDILAQNPVKTNGEPYTYEELYDAFCENMDTFAFGNGKRTNIIDVCAYDSQNGKLVELLKVDPVKRQMTGAEYSDTYLSAVKAMTNGGQVLGGLSNVSDGKMNSGGGTEIRISAEYQQFYRTPRERRLILEFMNRAVLPYAKKKLGLADGVQFEFKNILLQTLDQNKSGVSQKNGL